MRRGRRAVKAKKRGSRNEAKPRGAIPADNSFSFSSSPGKDPTSSSSAFSFSSPGAGAGGVDSSAALGEPRVVVRFGLDASKAVALPPWFSDVEACIDSIRHVAALDHALAGGSAAGGGSGRGAKQATRVKHGTVPRHLKPANAGGPASTGVARGKHGQNAQVAAGATKDGGARAAIFLLPGSVVDESWRQTLLQERATQLEATAAQMKRLHRNIKGHNLSEEHRRREGLDGTVGGAGKGGASPQPLPKVVQLAVSAAFKVVLKTANVHTELARECVTHMRDMLSSGGLDVSVCVCACAVHVVCCCSARLLWLRRTPSVACGEASYSMCLRQMYVWVSLRYLRRRY